MMDRIYLDHAATTAVLPEVLEAMLPYFQTFFGNPSSIHGTGREGARAVEGVRRKVAEILGAEPSEIHFTSGGTESDNWGIRGAAGACRDRGHHIVTTAIEHHAVLHTCDALEKEGFQITRLPVDPDGRVSPQSVEKAITPHTVLLSVMMANNEIGTIEPVEEIGGIAREHGVLFHTDAVQAIGALPVNVKTLNVDLLSFSAHKFHGPKGVGALYVKRGTPLHSLIQGGAQERGRRPGTENVPGIVGLGKAMEIASERMEENAGRMRMLRDRLINGVLTEIPDVRLNGHPTLRLPNNCNFSFPGVESEALLLRLDLEGIACSGGSACTSGSLDPSHVLQAIGLSRELAQGSIRMTLGPENTEEEVRTTLHTLKRIVADLRNLRGWPCRE